MTPPLKDCGTEPYDHTSIEYDTWYYCTLSNYRLETTVPKIITGTRVNSGEFNDNLQVNPVGRSADTQSIIVLTALIVLVVMVGIASYLKEKRNADRSKTD